MHDSMKISLGFYEKISIGADEMEIGTACTKNPVSISQKLSEEIKRKENRDLHMTNHTEFIFGCPQFYVQGPGILASMADYVHRLGQERQLLIIIDKDVCGFVKPMFESLENGKVPYDVINMQTRSPCRKSKA